MLNPTYVEFYTKARPLRKRLASGRLVRMYPALAAALLTVACSGDPAGTAIIATGDPNASGDARRLRDAALASARVWAPPAVAISEIDLASNPAGDVRFSPDTDLQCRFSLEEVGGTTPKFYCVLPDGERVKVKYGAENPELPAEVAATRLLSALGFPADRMYVVRSVTCAGCPRFPFLALRCLQRTGLRSVCFPGGIDENQPTRFDFVVVERRLAGRVVESVEDEGWAWYELDRIDPAHGGSPRTQVDAFRLMARFLAHWDNKAPNQRLICPPEQERPGGACAQPVAIAQDLGATFGPLKIDLENWRRDPVWQDPRTCTISMEHMPWGGATFQAVRISEEGRQMLADLLGQLSVAQLRGLFDGARVTRYDQVSSAARSADAWIAAFLDKVQQIRTAGPCPG